MKGMSRVERSRNKLHCRNGTFQTQNLTKNPEEIGTFFFFGASPSSEPPETSIGFGFLVEQLGA